MVRDEHEKGAVRATPERLPSMPTVAQRVVELAERRAVGGAELRRAVQADPALVLALLRTAGRGRSIADCHSLRAAIERLGVEAALRVCLEFRLLDRHAARGRDCIRQWRHALLSTAYARAIVRRLRRHDGEQIQTAAALCHLGGLTAQAPSREELAVWLAAQGVGEPLCALVHASRATEARDAAACIELAMRMAEVWLQPDWERHLADTHALADRLFGAVPDLCSWVFGVLGPQADDLEMLPQIRWPGRRQIAGMTARAQALLQDWLAPVPPSTNGRIPDR